MRSLWLIARYEFRSTLRKPSFWLFTLLVPALLIGVNIYHLVRDDGLGPETAVPAAETGPAVAEDPLPIALVDEAGIIAGIPDAIPEGRFSVFGDLDSGRAAMDEGRAAQLVHLSADYLASGRVTVYVRDFRLLDSGEGVGVAFGSRDAWMLPLLIDLNLVGDEILAAALRNPLPASLLVHRPLVPQTAVDEGEQALARMVANVTPYLYYFILVVVSGYLMRSIAADKENRAAEMLLTSLRPPTLLVGKIAGSSLVALLQLAVWLLAGWYLLGRGAAWFDVAAFALRPGFLVWAVLFLLLGYLLFASVMAAAASVAAKGREAGQVIWVLVIPLIPTLFFADFFFEDPNGPLPLVLSMIPFSAPSAMVTRLAVAPLPLWQPLASLLLLGLSALGLLWLAGRFFKAGNLLSTASFSWQRMLNGWRTRS